MKQLDDRRSRMLKSVVNRQQNCPLENKGWFTEL